MENWEDTCNRCGQCCFEKWVDEEGGIHPTPIPCRYLDIHTRQCRVYHKRFEVGEGCVKLTPDVVATVRWLPEDCAYLRHRNRPRDTGESPTVSRRAASRRKV